jgi:hypothetical protein
MPCQVCGTPVPGIDPDRGVILRDDVLCPPCERRGACINCRRWFAVDELAYFYTSSGWFVGPLCGRCVEAVADAEDVVRRTA